MTVPPCRSRVASARLARRSLAVAVVASFTCLGAVAHAREIDSRLDDVQVRFDNTVRYNVGVRVEPVDARIASSPAFTAGESAVRQGGVSTSRLDLLSELDVTYLGRFGARVSAAGWYDPAYQDASVTRAAALSSAPGTYLQDDFSSYTRNRYRGPWGEILDAFAFATVDAAGVPVSLKAGRHTVYWGESLMQSGATHGVCYSQMPLDLQKAWMTPGIEAKELFRPLANVSASAQLTPELSIAAQFFFEWQSYVYPEGGTFLGPVDAMFNGPDGVSRPLGGSPAWLVNGGVHAPREIGDWGAAVRWSPDWLDGTVGVYYRRYTDKVAAAFLSPNPGGAGPLSPQVASPYQYQQYYAEGIDLVGVSLAKQLLGASVGAEASFRHDTPLLAQSLGFVVAPAPPLAPLLFPDGAPELRGNSYQARGNTFHAVLNAVTPIRADRLFSTAMLAAEVTYSRWLSVNANEDMFYGEGYGVCRGDPALQAAGLAKSRRDGCATRAHVGVGASFTPTWYRALSGVDFQLPLAFAWTIDGNSPVTLGGNEGSGTWSAAVAADVRSRYRFELRYVDFFGRLTGSGAALSPNGLVALLQSRGSVTLTAKATF